jgi:tetratricopeptide (TPR) repeat protein
MQKRQATIGRPEHPSRGVHVLQVLQRGIELQRAQRFKEAEYHYQLVLREDPDQPDALNLLGTLAAEAKRYDKSVEYLERAVKARPKDPLFRNNLANAYILDGQHESAIAHLRRAIKAKPRFLEALCNLGRALRGTGKQAQAIEWFDKALALDARHRTALTGRSETLAELGRLAEAETGYRTVIAQYPGDAQGYFGLAGTRTFAVEDPEVATIEGLLRNDLLAQQDSELLHSAAGKIYNDQKRFDEAFAHFQKAKEISGRDFDVATHATFIDRTTALFSPLFFAARKGFGDESERPVFIVGMPRSGTTLTEQILSSHPHVYGAGELHDMQAIVRRVAGRVRESESYFQRLADLDHKQCLDAAREYLGVLAKLSPAAARVTDKMPHNFEALGFIALLYPNARVIHCRRDPLDNCVSCFTHRFNSFHGYNASLTKLGLYYRQYDRLMAHWRKVLPLRMLEVRYEDTIADQEGMSRKLIAFLGLDWDEACLAYHENERSVRTLSRWQVRQPIYSSSVKRWRNYEAHLGPLIAALGPLADVG